MGWKDTWTSQSLVSTIGLEYRRFATPHSRLRQRTVYRREQVFRLVAFWILLLHHLPAVGSHQACRYVSYRTRQALFEILTIWRMHWQSEAWEYAGGYVHGTLKCLHMSSSFHDVHNDPAIFLDVLPLMDLPPVALLLFQTCNCLAGTVEYFEVGLRWRTRVGLVC